MSTSLPCTLGRDVWGGGGGGGGGSKFNDVIFDQNSLEMLP